MLVTVNPLPNVNAGNDTILCNQPGGVQFNGTPAGGTWSGPNMNPTGEFDPNGVGIFDAIYSFTDANGCTNTDTVSIEVIDPTNADAGGDLEVCVDTGTVQLTGAPIGGTWSGPGISPTGIYTVTTDGDFELIYSYGSGNCLTSDTVVVTVHPLPSVNAGSDLEFCIDDGMQLVTGAPAGGTWSGVGLTTASGDFDPLLAGVGTHTLYYSYTNSNFC